jgi:hypothetical protein
MYALKTRLHPKLHCHPTCSASNYTSILHLKTPAQWRISILVYAEIAGVGKHLLGPNHPSHIHPLKSWHSRVHSTSPQRPLPAKSGVSFELSYTIVSATVACPFLKPSVRAGSPGFQPPWTGKLGSHDEPNMRVNMEAGSCAKAPLGLDALPLSATRLSGTRTKGSTSFCSGFCARMAAFGSVSFGL